MAAVLILALVGCADAESDISACNAEGMRAHLPAGEHATYIRACMGGKGYGYDMGKKECVSALSNGINFDFCYRPRWQLQLSGSR
jgi:hypothetical protein